MTYSQDLHRLNGSKVRTKWVRVAAKDRPVDDHLRPLIGHASKFRHRLTGEIFKTSGNRWYRKTGRTL